MYNTRVAPSNTGFAHLGLARTAYFNWLAARSSGGKFLLRIDDTDIDRSKTEYTQVILDMMAWLGLDYDAIEYQSSRLKRYEAVANQLVRDGRAVRIGTDGNVYTALWPQVITIPDHFTDELSGDVKISNRDKELMVPNFNEGTESAGIVLIRSNGMPTYHFASVVDDIDFGINYVIRGVDHLTNTARQVAIFTALNSPLPKFCHLGLINKDGKKLSKRDGAANILQYRDQGYDPDAILNGLCRLGWGPKVDDKSTAILPKEKMLELFLTGGRMRSSPANLDLVKLESFNRKYKALKAKL